MSQQIRILHMIALLEMGGTQSMIMNLYREIDRNKIQFDFIVDYPDKCTEMRKEIESLGGKIYSFPRFKGRNIQEVRRTWNRFFLEHLEYKVLHTHARSYASVYLPIAKKHGLVTVAHSHSTSNGKGIGAKIVDIMQLPIRHQADHLFACSKEAGDWLFGKRADYTILTNAINAEKFAFDQNRREIIRNELGLGDEIVIGNVGRLTEAKNQKFLLNVFHEFRKTNTKSKLLIIGSGDLEAELKSEADTLGISEDTIFLNAKNNIYDYYQAMDCFVFPSRWEGLGIAVIEAEAAGLPCLVSTAVPKGVDIGAGLVRFQSLDSDAEKWAECIQTLSRRECTTEYIINSGYDIRDNARKISDFYLKVYHDASRCSQ